MHRNTATQATKVSTVPEMLNRLSLADGKVSPTKADAKNMEMTYSVINAPRRIM